MYSIKDHKKFIKWWFSVEDMNNAMKGKTSAEKRRTKWEIAIKYFDGKARKTNAFTGWNVGCVQKGIDEIKTWKVYEDQRKWGNNKRWEDKVPWLRKSIEKIVEPHAQIDPTFKTAMAYVKITVPKIREILKEEWYNWENLPSERSLYGIVNRLWYSTKKVQKKKPIKKN